LNNLPKVLFVDDDLKILNMFEEFFSYSKSPVIECFTCSEPLEVEGVVQENIFDIIFLDFHYSLSKNPELNGVDILEILNNKIKNLPKIILLTGVSDIPVAVDSIKNGASDVLIKPIDLEKIKKIVLENYFFNINHSKEEKLDEIIKETSFVEDNSKNVDLDILDFLHINSLYKLDDIFKYISSRLIEENSDIYVFGGVYHKIEEYHTIFYKGSKSINDNQIDKILMDITGSPRYKETKFINYSPINNKKDEIDFFKTFEYKNEKTFFFIYEKIKLKKKYPYASSLFSSSVDRILDIEKDIKMLVEKVVEGSIVDFSNIMYKEV